VKLMRTVSAAIREDLGKVKDVLDIFVRRGGQPAELESQVGMLRKIADTLGVLGLGELRQLVIEETAVSRPWPRARPLPITPRWCTSPRR
jgi:chemosensory pili system protein ChpA (sensor histidine kinase/response regulator)